MSWLPIGHCEKFQFEFTFHFVIRGHLFHIVYWTSLCQFVSLIYLYLLTNTYTYVLILTYIYLHTNTVYTYTYIYLYIYLPTYLYLYILTYTYLHIYLYTFIHTYLYMNRCGMRSRVMVSCTFYDAMCFHFGALGQLEILQAVRFEKYLPLR